MEYIIYACFGFTALCTVLVGVAVARGRGYGRALALQTAVVLFMASVVLVGNTMPQRATETRVAATTAIPVVTPVVTPMETAEPTPEPTATMTLGQRNALQAAKNYLRYMPFSRSGLIYQLEFEHYSTEDATFAADNCGADWFEQAARKAADYLEYQSFSRDGLISQLEFEGYTTEEAEYGASQVGY